jgi:hypothetical protein
LAARSAVGTRENLAFHEHVFVRGQRAPRCERSSGKTRCLQLGLMTTSTKDSSSCLT